ncbi:DUF6406 domain-containing protein [Streptomyces sp. 6N223]|uniref:DUF6406 domain-containing protein n=1 Tax=Streptomyces sp. 6N223 TaxID=3457412 RepID=UPI003FD52E6A
MDAGSPDWPTTVEGRWRMRWHVPHHRFGEGRLTVVVLAIHSDPPRADITVRGSERALHKGLTVGDSVAIAGRRWRVAAIELGVTEAEAAARDYHADRRSYVDLHRIDA